MDYSQLGGGGEPLYQHTNQVDSDRFRQATAGTETDKITMLLFKRWL